MERKPLEVGLPDKIEILQRGMGIEIARKWFGPRFYFLIPFTVVWNGMMYMFVTQGLLTSEGDLASRLFPLPHLGVGIGLIYYSIAGIFNKTFVTVDRGRLAVRHSPVPWPGNMEINASDVYPR